MDNPSRRPLIIILGIVLLTGLCACATATAYFAYNAVDSAFADLLEDPLAIFDFSATEIPEETQTPLGADVDLEELFAAFWEAREIIHTDFIDQPVDDAALAQGARDELLAALEEAGVDSEAIELPADAPSAESLAEEAATPDEIIDTFLPFWQAWGKAEYANLEGLTYEELMQGALRGMVLALGDEHSTYLDPDQLRQSDLSLQGEYEGIGAWVDPTTEYLTIIAPMEGSPAEEAGLLPGDRVLAIDGEDMTGIDGNAVISRILGPAGSTVVMTIGRDGEPEPFDVEIVRAEIFVPSVQGEILEDGIAYVELFTFGAGSERELRQVLEDLLAEDPSAMILDLRNNGGGFLDTSVEIASEFIADGVVLYEEFGDGSRTTYRSFENGIATEIPLIVLINGGSASASEILAGVIQDTERGILVGETTFGKGSVQISPQLSNNQGALRLTIARWLTPDERYIQDVGLEPDVFVELTEADIEAGLDPQLDRAIELLTN